LELDGVILTKLDGDTRGGAALSVKHVTGVPIKFIGTGELVEALEEFHPDRMAGRILGMGDMLSLIEQASEKLDKEAVAKQEERLRKGEFTLDDFRAQMGQAKRLGSFSKLLGFIPGMGQVSQMMGESGVDADEEMRVVGGIIDSMTPEEKRNPKIIDNSRRRRIAMGAGVQPQRVNDLIKSFTPMAEMMKAMTSMNMKDKMAAMRQVTQMIQNNPSRNIQTVKKGTGKRLTPQEKADARKLREKEKKKREKEKRKK
jgi:signal recognition particle subunit SRP54